MIKKIRLKNFLSFADAEINLDEGANVLVGINGSGKSNLLKAIRLLKEGVSGMGLRKYIIDETGGLDNITSKSTPSGKHDHEVELEFLFESTKLARFGFRFREDIIYKIRLRKIPNSANYNVEEHIVSTSNWIYLDFRNGNGQLNELDEEVTDRIKTKLVPYQEFVEPTDLALSKIFDTQRYFALSTIRKAIGEIIVYDYFDTTPRSPIRKPMLPTSEKRLLADGTNLPQILNTIKINHKPSYNKIVSMLADVNPNFKGFDFNFLGGNIELMLEEEDLNSSIHVSAISDGTLRYLCLLSILFNPNRGSFICIDEPEVGLHPDMMSSIGNAILEVSEESSFMISTHSENILNCFEIEQIRVVEKDSSNSSIVSQFTKADFEGWYDSFSVGKMWRQGDFGGNRW